MVVATQQFQSLFKAISKFHNSHLFKYLTAYVTAGKFFCTTSFIFVK